MTEKIIAVIPAYNEEKTIGTVVNGLKKFPIEIIVVDDASTDRTGEIAGKQGAIVVTHDANMGYDKTISDGFQEAIQRNPTIIFTFDADGQHLPDDVPKVLMPIQNGEAEVVIGVRPHKQRLSEMLFSLYTKRRIGISDPLCGVKAYSVKAYETVGYFDNLNSIGTELLFNCHTRGFRIKEVAIRMKKRQDKPRFGRVFIANFKILLAMIKIYIKFR